MVKKRRKAQAGGLLVGSASGDGDRGGRGGDGGARGVGGSFFLYFRHSLTLSLLDSSGRCFIYDWIPVRVQCDFSAQVICFLQVCLCPSLIMQPTRLSTGNKFALPHTARSFAQFYCQLLSLPEKRLGLPNRETATAQTSSAPQGGCCGHLWPKVPPGQTHPPLGFGAKNNVEDGNSTPVCWVCQELIATYCVSKQLAARMRAERKLFPP